MELTDLKGVGQVTYNDKLKPAGFETIEDVARASVDELMDEAGLSEGKADKVFTRANREAVVLQSGVDVQDEYDKKEYVSTGMDKLDDLLGGGWEEEFLVTLSGESGSGKTQVAFHSMVRAVEQVDAPAVYIETEPNRYRPDRLRSLAETDDTQQDIYRIKAYDLDKQKLAYDKVREHFDEVSLVVVDSFTARFRLSEQFEGRGSLSQRSTEMSDHLRRLERLSEDLGAPILLTAQVYGNPSGFGAGDAVYGGSLMQHTVSCFVNMKSSSGNLKEAQLRGHPGQADEEVYINIGQNQLEAMDSV
ncbi:DNA repair and recombination protein RadA [Haloarcula virus HCTV-16]|nr:DNA repair and recombination protein RadA [Haloarcula virus HCTV-16]